MQPRPITDAELMQFMADEIRRGRNCGDAMDAVAAQCGGDGDRAWRLLEPTCEQVLRDLPEDDDFPIDQPYVVRWRHRVKRSSLKAAPRWVLIALSHYANKHGKGRFPSTDTLARDTGYTRRAVENHLRAAIRDGWLARRPRGLSGRGWRQYAYQLVIPTDVGNGVAQVEPYSREQRWERTSRRANKDGNDVPNLNADDGNGVPDVAGEVGNAVQIGREYRSHELLLNGNQRKKLSSEEDLSLHARGRARENGSASATGPTTDAMPTPRFTEPKPAPRPGLDVPSSHPVELEI